MVKKIKNQFYNLKDINKQIDNNPIKLILDAESNYRGQLFKLAKKILSSKNNKIVLLAGPSCAGKTTTAILLKEILEKYNKHVITVSMDDFFLDREKTPKLPDGNYDFDSVRTVNLEQMGNTFEKLFKNGRATFPRFDFKDGKNYEDGFNLELRKNTIVLFEGIHVLNPELLERLGTDKFFKIYATPFTGFETETHQITPQNLRLIRRMIRDVERRGHSPEFTLKMWKNVTDAEKLYIEPYKDDVDFQVNTTHAYELSLYKKELYALLFNHNEVIRALEFMPLFDNCSSIRKSLVPDSSLMWEFIDKE